MNLKTKRSNSIMRYRPFLFPLISGLLACLFGEPSAKATVPEGHWMLDETSGTIAADSSGNGNDGTYVNGPTLGVAGIRGKAAELNMVDIDDRIDLPNTVLDGAMAASVAFWIKTTRTGAASLLSGANAAQDNAFIILFTNSTNLSLRKDFYSVNVTIPSVSDNEWCHFIWTWDGDTNTATLYRNGLLFSSQVMSGSTGVQIDIDPGRLLLGQEIDCVGSCSKVVAGSLDDVQIYRRVLSAVEIAAIYDGLVGYWKLDETTGTVAADSSPQGHDGTYAGGPTLSVGGAYPGDVLTAVDFDGTNDHVDLPDMNLDFSYGFSAAFWVKPSASPGSGQGYAFLDLSNGQDVDEIWLGWFNTVGFQLYMTDTADGSSLRTIEDNTGFEVGKWVHCVATVDLAGNATLYRNGEVTKSGFFTSIPTNVLRTQNALGTSAWNDNFPGNLDDVRLYNRPLSATEVSELYGLTGHWKMDEGVGTTAADSTGFANDSTLSGATWTTDCAGKNSLAFDGINDTATTSATFDPPATGTVAFWMQASGTPTVRQRIFGVNGNWEARLETTGKISFDLGASPFVGNEPFATDVVDDQDRWYHIVAAFNESDDSYEVYVNGELQASGISPVNLVAQSAGILSFGTRTGSSENWNGSLRDFRVYNRWLDASEISKLSGLAGYWKLDETSGTVAVDSSLNGNDGTYTNGVLINQTGNVDQAADFDGTDDYVGVADNPSLQMDDTFSLSAWIRADSSANVNQMIINKEGEYELSLFPGGKLYWGVTNTDPGWSWHDTGHVVAIGKWTHVAMTYDNGTVNTYANGVLVDTYSGSGAVGDQYPSLNELRIGGRMNNPPGKYFDGRIDDVHVFSRVMCPEEVFGQYKEGRPAGVRILKWVEVR